MNPHLLAVLQLVQQLVAPLGHTAQPVQINGEWGIQVSSLAGVALPLIQNRLQGVLVVAKAVPALTPPRPVTPPRSAPTLVRPGRPVIQPPSPHTAPPALRSSTPPTVNRGQLGLAVESFRRTYAAVPQVASVFPGVQQGRAVIVVSVRGVPNTVALREGLPAEFLGFPVDVQPA